MIIYSVYDAGEDLHKAFTNKKDAIAFARDECTEGTEVQRNDIGALTKQRACDLYNGESCFETSTVVYTSPKRRTDPFNP